MEYSVNGSKITAIIGESAKMDVQKAVHYIESGKAELSPLVAEAKGYKEDAESAAVVAQNYAGQAESSAERAEQAASSIPTVNDATLTIQKNGSNVATFTANQGTNATANIVVPTKTSDLSNDSGFISGITSSDVTTALGYTPADSASLATVATTGDYDDLLDKPTLGTMAAESASDYTKTSGLATVATTGDYDDLLDKPTIPAAQVNSDWNANSGVAEILNKPTLGTMAAESASDYTKTSGLATVATTGDYDDLLDKPTIPAAQVNSDWNANSGVAEILNKPTLGTMAAESASDYTKTSGLATVATSGSYNDLSNKPTIPTTTNSVTSGSTAALTSGGAYTALQGYANTSLSNLSSGGQMVVDTHNGTISNCILEIPQNLNVSIASNVVTLASGSVITLTGSTYATYTLTAAQTYTIPNTLADGKYYLFTNSSGVIQAPIAVSDVVSISSLPTSGNYCYLTSDKLIYQYSSGWSATSLAYPIAMIDVESGVASFTKDSNGNDMIFNGAGFIGHHAFVYPNVKALRPDGFNADGTLKSIEINRSSLTIIEIATSAEVFGFTSNTNIRGNGYGASYSEVDELPTERTTVFIYLKSENKMYEWTSNSGYVQNNFVYFLSATKAGSTVTDFTIRHPVRLATIEMLDKVQGQVDTNTSDIANKQDTLVSGTSIKTINSTSLLGSGDISLLTSADIANMQTTTNLVTSVSSASTDSQYPSAKLFYDTCGDIETLINAL